MYSYMYMPRGPAWPMFEPFGLGGTEYGARLKVLY